ncbi:unnamed protein product [Candidula unifasciata]|uniref:Antistasin-like domain-containing protein n=1 Tax=Candidula unifasciata TaxID=100452 RepID=A0A8S3ZNK9_9EUPU|nr:unnamed protein product [Candidula unifasciata]
MEHDYKEKMCETLGVCCSREFNDYPVKCSIQQCPAPPYGCRTYIVKDASGCPTGCDYACGTPWCGPRPCTRLCVQGYCKDIGHHKICDTQCPSGYVLDSKGCSVCQCKLEFPSCLAVLKCSQGLCPDSCMCQPDCFDKFPLPDNPNVFAL